MIKMNLYSLHEHIVIKNSRNFGFWKNILYPYTKHCVTVLWETFIKKKVHSHEKKIISYFILLKYVRRKGRSDLVAPWDATRPFLETNSFNDFIYIEILFSKHTLKNQISKTAPCHQLLFIQKSFTANETINYQTSQMTWFCPIVP